MVTLESFKTLKKLTVHRIRIEPKSVKADYSVERYSGETTSFEHIYSYEQSYFDKSNPDDANLASMMLAQVALNYGLFFETIEFDGLYDRTDQQFLRRMMENTSREILTNKLLINNIFIKPPFNDLQAGKREKYTQANILFPASQFKNYKTGSGATLPNREKFAILSSGGKDSLLTYGMIKEIGEPFPVFINEAGRHWFTAVNSYRYYQETEPNTVKPWCNSDRLFNWMLKQFPFIKENYTSIRADIYPLRLWTVAVFLFGVLPIVLKKGIGNILIGNEYDTTLIGNLAGISHYSALFDQSKFFDNTLTRYYKAKGWNIYQYSLLRSLSELLIMKILLKRYPELQKHQVSCHAAHEENGRMYPCGKCEKCRRIIGMIRALDENPEECGYSKDQIINGLHALESKEVKQIGSDAAHLYYMLSSKNLIPSSEFVRKVVKPHPEVLKLRFDRERSNLEDLPGYIRKPLFNILSQYADGAVEKVGNRWNEVSLDDDFLNNAKYKFDER